MLRVRSGDVRPRHRRGEGALAAGARYADARVMVVRHEAIAARNGVVEDVTQAETAGVGVRALLGSSWGFQATPELSAAAARAAGEGATAVARASAQVPGPPLELAPVPPVVDSWSSTWVEHPLDDVERWPTGPTCWWPPPSAAAEARACRCRTPPPGVGHREVVRVQRGRRIDQRIVECGAVVDAIAVGDGETQRRSYPGVRGQYGTSGWELVRGLDLVANAALMAEQAQALLTAPVCPEGETTLILDSSQTALQIHESVGHAVELDRILGWEAAFAGTSWLDPAQLGDLRFGSELMQITADATLPGRLGSFGYDDEGVAAQRVDIVRDGRWVGVLSGRDSAPLVGLPSGGMVRADGPARLPMVRMTNVGLLPGDSSLDEMIAGTDDGIYMAPTGRGRSTTSGSTSSSAARSAGRSRTAPSAAWSATPRTPASVPRSGRPSTPSAAATSGPCGACPRAARASRCRSATPGTTRRPPASATCGWACARRTGPAGAAGVAGRRHSDSTNPGSSWIEVELVEALPRRVRVGHVLELPRVRVREVGGVATQLDHGQHVRAHRVADHEEAVGSTPRRRSPAGRSARPSRTRSRPARTGRPAPTRPPWTLGGTGRPWSR